MVKKFINYSLKKIGYKISKNKDYTFDHIYSHFLNNKSIIIDIGSNEGQSIDRFLKIVPDAKIHCFEPVDEAFQKIKNHYKKDNLFINKIALGNKSEKKLINVFIRTSNSSFNEPIINSFWEKKNK